MFDVIRDFLLIPALVTVGLLALPAGALGLVARAMSRDATPPPRGGLAALMAWFLGLQGTLLAILMLFSISVLRGQELVQLVAWPATALAWWLPWRFLARLGVASLWAAVAVAVFAWGIDTWLTSAILFE
jgi:hypothetical protein